MQTIHKNIYLIFKSKVIRKTLNVNGIPWDYICQGKGPNLLLLAHGGYLNSLMYFNQIESLDDYYKIVAPTCPPNVSNLNEITKAFDEILELENTLDGTVDFLGLSFGGIIAQVYVSRHPDIIRKLILSNTLVNDQEFGKKFRHNLRWFKILPERILLWLFNRQGVNDEWSVGSIYRDAVLSYFSDVKRSLNKTLIVSRTKCLFDFVNHRILTEEINKSKIKILILSSVNDSTRNQVEKLKNRYPNARVHIFDRGGHHTFLFFPEEYNSVIKSFLLSERKLIEKDI